MSSLRVDFAAPNFSQKCESVKMRLGEAVSILVSTAILSLRLILSKKDPSLSQWKYPAQYSIRF